MAKSECRYDHVVVAANALSKYMDSSSSESDTKGMLNDAGVAIEKLKHIESCIKTPIRQRAKKSEKLSTALDELKLNSDAAMKELESMDEFWTNNSETIAKMEIMLECFSHIKQHRNQLRKVCNSVKSAVNFGTKGLK